jgi:hypothetical protein
MAELGVAGDEVDEVGALERRSVVGDDRQRLELVGARHPAILEQLMTEQPPGLADRDFEGLDRIARRGRAGDRRRQAQLGRVVDDGQDPPGPPAVVSNSVKSACQTRLRRAGGSTNTARRAWASCRRSAR